MSKISAKNVYNH